MKECVILMYWIIYEAVIRNALLLNLTDTFGIFAPSIGIKSASMIPAWVLLCIKIVKEIGGIT